ncbi:MAG: efflux RND transporter permease subunit [Myxococcales bacterium]|nr:efflux RND transporter permease subunit [Myxococcales bacterium]
MSIAGLFIRRPVMTTLVMVAILGFGIGAFTSLPVSDLPNVDFPTIQVQANLPGASPDTMAASVATPLEREFSTIDGIQEMTSTSGLGSTSVTLLFSTERDLDSAAQDVQAAISRAAGRLPPDMTSPPSYRKVNPSASPILYIALTSETMPTYRLDEYAETVLAQRISTVSGVAQVAVYGSQKYAVRVQVDPDGLAAKGLGIDEVASAIKAANVNLPTGTLNGASKAFTLETNGQLTEADAYRPLIVAYRDGRPVRLAEIATVTNSVENNKTAAWFRDQRAIILAIQRQPGTNTVNVADAVRELLPSFQERLPAAVRLNLLYDRSQTIRASVHEVEFTLVLTLGLVIMVIFMFLRNVSATVIPSLAIPMSLVGTFAIMYLLGYSLDNLSLMALTLSVGFVVDDAIVMLENIVRHMEMGKKPYRAAIDGAREVGFTIVSMTLSLAAVFLPILFMGGVVGNLFREFGVTIAVAILVSGVVSLSLTPMLCSRFVRPPKEEHGRLYRAMERVFDGLLAFYDWGLRICLRHRVLVLAFSALILAGTVWLFQVVPAGFLPSEDNDQLFITTVAAESISFDDMVAHQQELAGILLRDPDIDGFMSSAGARNGRGGSNQGMIFVHLKAKAEREASAAEIIARLRPQLAAVPGIIALPQIPPPIRLSGRLSKSDYQLALSAPDVETLYRAAPELEKRMGDLPGVRDVTSDLELKNPQVTVDIDRDRAIALGVSVQQVEEALYSAFGNRQVSSIYASTDTYQVILELDPAFQRDPSALASLKVRSSRGELVPLEAVADVGQSLGPLTVNHTGQLPSVTLGFGLEPGTSLGTATERITELAGEVLPAGVTMGFSGTASAFQDSTKNLGLLLLMSILVIYLVLGILYESFIHPLTILSALPFAGFGALATLWLFDEELSVYAFVGIVMLVGLVKKNGIMMVDFALEARAEGKTPMEAIHEACRVRFRPITMTTMAALVGTLPIALGYGAGAESRRPLGLAVVGGLLFSQVLTLYVTPVFYLVMEDLQRFVARHVRAGRASDEEATDATKAAPEAPATATP